MGRVLNCGSPAVISHPVCRVCAGTEVACSQVPDSIAASGRDPPEIRPWAGKTYLGAVVHEESWHFSPYLTQGGRKNIWVFQLAIGSLTHLCGMPAGQRSTSRLPDGCHAHRLLEVGEPCSAWVVFPYR